jgi:hypothetical protein
MDGARRKGVNLRDVQQQLSIALKSGVDLVGLRRVFRTEHCHLVFGDRLLEPPNVVLRGVDPRAIRVALPRLHPSGFERLKRCP